MPPRSRAPRARTADVTAVLVASDGAEWLPDALAALAASTVRPSAVVCVDTGSVDRSPELMRAAHVEVLILPRGSGFGAAVHAALQTVPRASWIWLLHDDAAPEPDALEALLRYASDSPSAALLGPKVRDWDDPRVLVEVGVTTDAAGHRETGLDRREYDQGQHDGIRDVLAVGTAGALIRRDVWDDIGGLDPQLPVFRDDLDLGWRVTAAGHRVVVVPTAAIRHARAATTGRRAVAAASGRPAGIDRRNAVFVLLAHAAGPRLLLTLPRLGVACLLRVLGFLLTRQILAARDEVAALLSVLGRPARLAHARRARARTRTTSPGVVKPLLAKRSSRVRAKFGALADWMSGGSAPGSSPLLGDPGSDGDLDDLTELTPAGGGLVKRLLLEPGVVLTLSLALVALFAERAVLSLRGGTLLGGRLLPVPSGARDLWGSYLAAWHPSAVGSSAAAHPCVAALAVLSTLLVGKTWLALDTLLLAGIPIAGAVAYVVSGRLTAHRVLRVWAAATWALLPVATGSVADGRLDGAVVQIALPALVAGSVTLLNGRRNGWSLGLGLAIAAAFAPLLWPLVAGLLLAGALVTLSLRRIAAATIVALVPALVLFPWWTHPAGLLDGPGRLLPEAPHDALQLLLLNPGTGAVWVTAGLLLAALGGLLRRDAHRCALAMWAVALTGFAAAVAMERRGHWPGIALQVAASGVLGAALVGANQLRTRLGQTSFGWRQLTAALIALAAAAGPVAEATSWVNRGADHPLERDMSPLLPAFARAELAASPGLRVLVVRPRGNGVAYELATAAGVRFGAADTSPTAQQLRRLDAVVADVLTARGSDAAEALATRAVRYVAVPAKGGKALAAALDVQAGLSRRASGEVLLWRVVAPAARLTQLSPPAAAAALRGDRGPSPELLRTDPPMPLPAGREAARTSVPRGRPGRLLVLAEAASSGWQATVGGTALPKRTAWGWAQGFVLPTSGGSVHIRYDQGPRHRALLAQGLAIALVLILAAPAARRRRGLEVVDDESEAAPVRELQGAGR
ncbi:MAG: glycosyltransferase [Mycobacteriales bacterium]